MAEDKYLSYILDPVPGVPGIVPGRILFLCQQVYGIEGLYREPTGRDIEENA
jgi:hypothetical protein